MPKFWLMKSEPDQFGIADLARVKIEPWTGVRSTFARFHMRQMSVGDGVLFHHSSVSPPGVAGLARVVRTRLVDETQFDPDSPYHDPKATRERPIWDCVEVEYVATLPHFVAMDRMRADPRLSDMVLLQGRGMRLSVQPVTEAEYSAVVELGHTAPPAAPPRSAPPRTRTPARRVARPARSAPSTRSTRSARSTKTGAARAKRPARGARTSPPARSSKKRR
jgi:predicted RNA-binding protein with PUA-like domain